MVRIDKFLWSVRVYKTRSISSEECRKGRVLIAGAQVKPSRNVVVGDIIEVKKSPVTHVYRVKAELERRVGAKIVVDYIDDLTPIEELEKLNVNQLTLFVKRDKGAGRPTKKERREIEKVGGDDDIEDED